MKNTNLRLMSFIFLLIVVTPFFYLRTITILYFK